MPEKIVLQLSHKDVNLGYFKFIKRNVLALRAGDNLILKDNILYETVNCKPVGKLSQKMQATLKNWEDKGYQVKSAIVSFIVAWKPKDTPKDEEEYAVLLADLVLSL